MHRSDRRRPGFPFRSLATLLLVALPQTPALARPFTVAVSDRDGAPLAGVAIYFEAVDSAVMPAGPAAAASMDQVNLEFVPRLLVIQRGAEVDFPNSDTVSHHVYSFRLAWMYYPDSEAATCGSGGIEPCDMTEKQLQLTLRWLFSNQSL
jgi:hypothetical protein